MLTVYAKSTWSANLFPNCIRQFYQYRDNYRHLYYSFSIFALGLIFGRSTKQKTLIKPIEQTLVC